MARATRNWQAIADHHVYRLDKRQERRLRFLPAKATGLSLPPLQGPPSVQGDPA